MKLFYKLMLIIALIAMLYMTPGCHPGNDVKSIKIGMCSDVHLPTMHDSEQRITAFIDSMKIAKPDFIIELGDFGIPKPEYEPFMKIWNSFPGPEYHVIGNHEMDGGTSLEKALAWRDMKNSYYSFEQNGFHFIVLDGNDKKSEEQKGYRSYIGPKQMKWLRKELQVNRGPIVIFSHQGLGSDPGVPGERYSVETAGEIRKMLEEHNKTAGANRVIACFNGHTHHDYAEQINDIWYITINSMAYKWLGEKYGHIRYSDEVDKNFKWIKYTAPYKDPLFTVVEIATDGKGGAIKMSGKYSSYVGPSPWEIGYPERLKKYVKPQITERVMKF